MLQQPQLYTNMNLTHILQRNGNLHEGWRIDRYTMLAYIQSTVDIQVKCLALSLAIKLVMTDVLVSAAPIAHHYFEHLVLA